MSSSFQDFLDRLKTWWQNLWGAPPPPVYLPAGSQPDPVETKVLLINYDPPVSSAGNRRLSEVMGWNRVDALVKEFIDDIRATSYGYANFRVVTRIDVDHFPVKQDGFTYIPDDFVGYIRSQKGFHQPDQVAYLPIIQEFNLSSLVNQGQIDEVWIFGPPYGGFYESCMAGPDPFWCNGPALPSGGANRRFVIMGFNYERGVGEMHESFCHRAESILTQVFRNTQPEDNLWERFTRHEKTHPGLAEVGTVHFAPNSQRDYDWGNPRLVLSRCDNWAHFPDLSGPPRQVTCSEWGNGDIRKHHTWWERHLPHWNGEANGIAYNWWEYLLIPDHVK